MVTALKQAGFPEPHVATAQAEPDPDFPTVSFPNPEEPGAMDLAMALAEEVDADIVVANDPDADRCAVAVPGGPHGWQMLRGDEVGALLAQHLLGLRREGVYATSIVSSSLLGKMAVAEKQLYAETLTGFKWIGRVENLAFGYEEALGYCVDPAHVKDKDGVSALMMVCDIAARAKAAGRTLRDLLDDLAREHGLHATDQLSVRMDDLAAIPAVVDRLRDQPPDLARRARGRAGRRPLARVRAACPDRRAAVPAGRRRPGRRTPLGDRAEDQVLPRGRRPRGGRRRTASTPPASPRSAASTRSAATCRRRAGTLELGRVDSFWARCWRAAPRRPARVTTRWMVRLRSSGRPT